MFQRQLSGIEAQVDDATEVTFWRVVGGAATAAVAGTVAWLRKTPARLRGLEQRMSIGEEWQERTEDRLESCAVESRKTHDAVLVLETQMKGVREDIGEVKDGQSQILAELRSRPRG